MTVREFHAELTRRIVENPELAYYQVCGESTVSIYHYDDGYADTVSESTDYSHMEESGKELRLVFY